MALAKLGPYYESALRYSMGLPVSTTIVGMESMDQLKKNLAVAENFTPLSDEEKLEFYKEIIHLATPEVIRWKTTDYFNPVEWISGKRSHRCKAPRSGTAWDRQLPSWGWGSWRADGQERAEGRLCRAGAEPDGGQGGGGEVAGASVAATPRQAVAGVDIVVTMVADPPALAAVLEGRTGLRRLPARHLVVDMSTVDPGRVGPWPPRRKASASATWKRRSRRRGGGRAGTLTIMAGEASRTLRRRSPPGNHGKKILYVGPMGHGSVLKLATNVVAAASSR